jgi:hypothetical protein
VRDEQFRSGNSFENWLAGAFDYQLELENMDDDQVDHVCEWLSMNCTENFVVIRTDSYLIAGGTTDNRRAWQQRDTRFGRDRLVKLRIRLHAADTMMFRLAWLGDRQSRN